VGVGGAMSIPDSVLAVGAMLERYGLVTGFGHVSVRTGGGSFSITPARPLGFLRAGDDMIAVSSEGKVLPEGAPGETWLHSAIYSARPDVQVVVRAQPPASHPAGVLEGPLSPIHGQGAWLGSPIPVHNDAHLVRSAAAGREVAAALGAAPVVVLRGNGAVTVGSTPAEAATRQWVLEQTCIHILRVSAAARPFRALNPEELSSWSSAWPELWPRLWSYLLERR